MAPLLAGVPEFTKNGKRSKAQKKTPATLRRRRLWEGLSELGRGMQPPGERL
jgi:hypothetical protein